MAKIRGQWKEARGCIDRGKLLSIDYIWASINHVYLTRFVL